MISIAVNRLNFALQALFVNVLSILFDIVTLSVYFPKGCEYGIVINSPTSLSSNTNSLTLNKDKRFFS